MTNKSPYRRLHTFKKAYHLAKHFSKGAEGDPFLASQARYYKSLAEAWAFSPKDKAKVQAIAIP